MWIACGKLLSNPEVQFAGFGEPCTRKCRAISGEIGMQGPVGIEHPAVTTSQLTESLLEFGHGVIGTSDPDREGPVRTAILHSGRYGTQDLWRAQVGVNSCNGIQIV